MGKNSKIAILAIIVVVVVILAYRKSQQSKFDGSFKDQSSSTLVDTAKIADLMAKGYTEAEAKQLAASTNY